MKKAIVSISSITGNTRLVVSSLREVMEEYGYLVQEYDLPASGNEIIRDLDSQSADILIMGFWCRKGSLDPSSLKLLQSLKNQKILAIGTLGYYPDTEYGDQVRKRVFDEISKENTCLGVFICQGKVKLERTEKRRNLPKDHPHYLDDAGYKRHLDSQSHPDEIDVQNARNYLKFCL